MTPILTPRQTQLLQFIRQTFDLTHQSPTVREIGRHMGIRSSNGVADKLAALQRKGVIVITPLQPRGITLQDGGSAA